MTLYECVVRSIEEVLIEMQTADYRATAASIGLSAERHAALQIVHAITNDLSQETIHATHHHHDQSHGSNRGRDQRLQGQVLPGCHPAA
jgi:hypothetical protein